MKYMVMECHTSYAIVLDENGNFLKVANLHYQVGETVSKIVKMQEPIQKISDRTNRWIYAMTTLAACIVIMLTSTILLKPTPYASIYISINPKVRIDVDKQEQVLYLIGENIDGKELIKDYNYHKKSLSLVMDELLDKAIHMHYLTTGKAIHITLESKDNTWKEIHHKELLQHIQEHLQDKVKVDIYMDKNIKKYPNTSSSTNTSTYPANSNINTSHNYGARENTDISDIDKNMNNIDNNNNEENDSDKEEDDEENRISSEQIHYQNRRMDTIHQENEDSTPNPTTNIHSTDINPTTANPTTVTTISPSTTIMQTEAMDTDDEDDYEERTQTSISTSMEQEDDEEEEDTIYQNAPIYQEDSNTPSDDDEEEEDD